MCIFMYLRQHLRGDIARIGEHSVIVLYERVQSHNNCVLCAGDLI